MKKTETKPIKITAGYTADWCGQATEKYQIITETSDGMYVCAKCPVLARSAYGNLYLTPPLSGLTLKPKTALMDIHTEELNPRLPVWGKGGGIK